MGGILVTAYVYADISAFLIKIFVLRTTIVRPNNDIKVKQKLNMALK